MRKRLAFFSRPDPRITDYFQLIDYAVHRGITSLEGFHHLGLETGDLETARRIRDYADKKGVSFCCFSAGVNVVGPDRCNGVAYLKKLIDVAHILGSPFIHHTIALTFKPFEHTQEETDKTVKEAAECICEAYDYAAQYGMRAIYENQAYLFNGIRGMEMLFNAVDRDIGLVADIGNMYQLNEECIPFIERFHDKIVHVHIKDMEYTDAQHPKARLSPNGRYVRESNRFGLGAADIAGALRALKRHGYNGMFALEGWGHTANDPWVDINIERVINWMNG